jgi:hypothetical protein
MSATDGKVMEDFNLQEHRRALINNLEHVITVSRGKFDMEKASNRDRQSWGRLIVSAGEPLSRLFDGIQYEALEERVRSLKEKKTTEEE